MTPDQENGKFYIYKYSELFEYFKTCGQFLNPASTNNSSFDFLSIEKLLLLCSHNQKIMEDCEQFIVRSVLYSKIEQIKEVLINFTPDAFWLSECYWEKKEEIKMFLSLLFRLSMFMRGWDEETEYPISKSLVSDEGKINVDLNVSKAIVDLEDFCQKEGDFGLKLFRLHLMRYRGKQFIISNNFDDGLTIQERINIVKMGESGNQITSCIRTSSNWLASSYYYYTLAIREKPNFDINDMASIA